MKIFTKLSVARFLSLSSWLLIIIITGSSLPLRAQTNEPPSADAPSLGEYPWPSVWLKSEQGKVVHITPAQKATYPGLTPSPSQSLNFNPVIGFEQSGLDIAYSLEGLPGLTAITVYQAADTTERGVWATERGLSRHIRATTRRVLGPDSVIDVYQAHPHRAVINTVTQHWEEAKETSPDAFLTLGRADPKQKVPAFQGHVAEFLVFDRSLSFLERLQVETYLALKYGIPLTVGNYVSAHQQVLWHQEENQGYAHRIAGIGRDDAYGLYQKQSTSTYDTSTLLTISHETLATTNARNTSRIDDQNFLVWGDNDLPLLDKLSPGTGADDTLLLVIQRKWLMEVTGTQASRLSTELRINVGQFPQDSLGYWLVIDRSGQGNFSVDNLEYITADRIEDDSIAVYSNLRWDTDGSGTDHFGFARKKYMLPLVRSVAHVSCARPGQGSAVMTVLGGRAPFRYQLTREGDGFTKSWSDDDTTQQAQLTAGEYRLAVTDADDYEMSRRFSVKVLDAIAVEAGPDQRIYPGQQIRLEGSAAVPDSVAVSYTWTSNYGFRSTGLRAIITESGIYTLTVTNRQGCQFSDEVVVSGSNEQRFAVLPNLVAGGEPFYVNVSLPQAGPVEVSMYDLSGNRKQHIRADHRSEYQFPLQLHEAGMYVVALQTSRGVTTQKLVVY